ncbi:MAG TPA: site-2 protease family protein [Alphaproteobacteria bacterium]|nr:site-2 protease family protein [Alphaproteobacteria bacterium]
MFTHRIKIFTLFGFRVWVDASWLLVAALVAWSLAVGVFPEALPNLDAATYWWMAVTATIGFLLSIVFHETAHSLVARRYGMDIRGITLFIFGGVAEMEGEPRSARGEFLMALAGPLASLLLAAGLIAGFWLTDRLGGPASLTEIFWYLGYLNGVLAAFNLVPAFPLDGGRMLRAALWGWRGDIGWATQKAAAAGNAFGTLLIVLGVIDVMRGDFVGGMWQFLIGLFLRAAAAASLQQTMAQEALTGVSVAQVMTPDPVGVPPGITVTEFVERYVYRYHHRDFPVGRDGRLLGTIGTRQAAALDRSRWTTTAVSEVMAPCSNLDVVGPDTPTLAAMAQMTKSGRSRLFVVQDGRLVGIVSLRDLLSVLAVKLELGAAGPAADRAASSDRPAMS